MTLYCEQGGAGGPPLVLLHGLGGNAAVWDGLRPLLERQWPGRWLAPDLCGHGRSPHRAHYGIGLHAADVAALIDGDDAVTLLGHSMGGAVAIALASGLFGIRVKRVVAFAVKVDWSAEEIARAARIAETPPRRFDTREAAVERSLLVAGLGGLVAPTARAAELGVSDLEGGYRLAMDPRANAVGALDLPALARLARAPLHLLSGEADRIGAADAMRKLGAGVTVLAGLGHSPHVEAPEALYRAIRDALLAD